MGGSAQAFFVGNVRSWLLKALLSPYMIQTQTDSMMLTSGHLRKAFHDLGRVIEVIVTPQNKFGTNRFPP